MPIFAVMVVAILLGAAGLVIGGGIGAVVASFFHLRSERAYPGAETRPAEEISSSGCQALLFGAFMGSVLGCGAALGLGYLVAVLLAE